MGLMLVGKSTATRLEAKLLAEGKKEAGLGANKTDHNTADAFSSVFLKRLPKSTKGCTGYHICMKKGRSTLENDMQDNNPWRHRKTLETTCKMNKNIASQELPMATKKTQTETQASKQRRQGTGNQTLHALEPSQVERLPTKKYMRKQTPSKCPFSLFKQ